MRSFLSLALATCLSLATLPVLAQSIHPADRVSSMDAKAFELEVSPFQLSKTALDVPQLSDEDIPHTVLDVDADLLEMLFKSAPDAFQLDLPGKMGSYQLYAVDLLAEGFAVRDAISEEIIPTEGGQHYRGIATDDPTRIIAVSVFSDEISALITSDEGSLSIGRLQDRKDGSHVAYNEALLTDRPSLDCGTPDEGPDYTKEDLMDVAAAEKGPNNCVRVYLEIDEDIYNRNNRNSNATRNQMTAIFNQVGTVYSIENIRMKLTSIFLWRSADGYNSSVPATVLNSFVSRRTSFTGDVAYYTSIQLSGGRANGIGGLCTTQGKYCVGQLSTRAFQPFPIYTYNTYIMAHEIGHVLGSYHTHNCRWNGNGTAIDGCAGFTEGNCAIPGSPNGQGTIMSYCNAQGINFNNGFGPQPGNVVRNKVYNQVSCLSTTCGGGNRNCNRVNIRNHGVRPFGGQNQGTNFIYNDEYTVGLFNNSWIDIPFNYTVTANTVIEFQFGTGTQGEIHGIGFDNNNNLDGNYIFKLYGTQNFGRGNFNGQYSPSNYRSYRIPVGQYYTGNFNRIVLVADDDRGGAGDSWFRNIRVYENGTTCPRLTEEETAESKSGEVLTDPQLDGGSWELPIGEEPLLLSLFPNPVDDQLTINLTAEVAGTASLRVLDFTGRVVTQRSVNLEGGTTTLTLPTDRMTSGAYLIHVEQADGQRSTQKFSVMHR